MAQKVFALYDVQENRLHMFVANAEQAENDTVNRFIAANVDEFFTTSNLEQAEKLQSVISETTSTDELKSALVGWDFQLEMIQVD